MNNVIPHQGIIVHLKTACWIGYAHKVLMYIYKEYHSVCPLVGIGTPPPPLPLTSVSLPLESKGGGAHFPACEGWGSPDSDDWRKSLALCLLCGYAYRSLSAKRIKQCRIFLRNNLKNL